MREFTMAALPFVTFGIVLAIVCVYHNWKEQKKAQGEDQKMKCSKCGKEMRKGYLFSSKDGAFSFANEVLGVFENMDSIKKGKFNVYFGIQGKMKT